MHEYMHRDPLEECLIRSHSTEELENEQVTSNPTVVENILTPKKSEEAVIFEEESTPPDGLVLKELPTRLRYAFVGNNSTKAVPISVVLNDEM